MFRPVLLAAATFLATAPACADPWINYDGYRAYPAYTYPVPYAYPAYAYSEYTAAVPVTTYVPMRVRVYAVPLQPPYYNVPPYPVYAPY